MWKTSRAVVAMVFFALAGCASAGGIGSPQGRADLLTEEQIRHQNFSTAYDAVLALRPTWLRMRGPDSFNNPGQIQVYLDNMRIGPPAVLQQIPAVTVSYIRWHDGVDAAGRWGLDHGNGVIYVSTTPLR